MFRFLFIFWVSGSFSRCQLILHNSFVTVVNNCIGLTFSKIYKFNFTFTTFFTNRNSEKVVVDDAVFISCNTSILNCPPRGCPRHFGIGLFNGWCLSLNSIFFLIRIWWLSSKLLQLLDDTVIIGGEWLGNIYRSSFSVSDRIQKRPYDKQEGREGNFIVL